MEPTIYRDGAENATARHALPTLELREGVRNGGGQAGAGAKPASGEERDD